MSAISISLNPGLFNWLKQSPVFRFVFPCTNSSADSSGQPDSSAGYKRETGNAWSEISRRSGKTALIIALGLAVDPIMVGISRTAAGAHQ